MLLSNVHIVVNYNNTLLYQMCVLYFFCLGVDPLDMPRTPYRASEGKRS